MGGNLLWRKVLKARFCLPVFFILPFFSLCAGEETAPRPLRHNRAFAASTVVSVEDSARFKVFRETVRPLIPGLNEKLTANYIKQYSEPASLKWLSGVLGRAAPYMAFIRREIEERGLPPELLYLPVIESEYVITAKSKTGAGGLWQFMPNSVKPYMEMNEWLDERFDFWKSTTGALSKLESNYHQFGDWALALAAYNMGAGAVTRVIKESGSNDYWKLAEKKRLSQDAANYVPKLLAIYYIASNPRKFGLDVPWHDEYQWTRLAVRDQTDITILAEKANVDEALLRMANSELVYNVTPPGDGYQLKVLAKDFAAVNAVLEDDNIQLVKNYIHVIRSGDTLYALSRHYGTPVEKILEFNPALEARFLKLGERIVIPALR
jgi:membrane-bound lytic murein transglycosylase D